MSISICGRLVAVLKYGRPGTQGILQLCRVETSAFATFEIQFAHMSDIVEQALTHHSPYPDNINSAASCRTYVFPLGVQDMWDSETGIR